MDFEPLDEALEDALGEIVEAARDTGWADGVDFTTPEYRELRRLGMFDKVDEYYDGTASVMPSYRAMRYFERKEKWEAERRAEAAKGVGGRIADVGGSVLGSALSKFLGL